MTDLYEQIRGKLGRRDFLKLLLVSGSALATTDLLKLVSLNSLKEVLAISGSGPYYYGTDTSWAVDTKGSNASNFSQNFYIGRTGVGELIYNDSSFFPTAADKAGYSYTHTYWLLKGPYYKYRGSRTAYQYGYDQGTKAAYAWYHHTWYLKIGGKTFFADIEEGSSSDPQSDYYDGWGYYYNGYYYVDYASNRSVLDGFIDAVNNYSPDFNPGVYSRLDLWENWFNGTDGYNPAGDLVVWLCDPCGFVCSPCGTCTSAKTEADSKFNAKKNIAFGKYKTVIWQFFYSECPAPDCADYDIARQNGYIRFSPVQAIYLPIIMKNEQQLKSDGGQEFPDSYPPPGTPSPYP